MRGQDLLLIAVVAVTFVFGYFLVKKIDRFLEENCQEPADDGDESRWNDRPDSMGTTETPKQAAGEYPGAGITEVEKRNVSCYNQSIDHTGVRK